MILTDIAPRAQTASKSDQVLLAAQAALGSGDYTAALQVVLPFLGQVPVTAAYLDIAITCYWHMGDSTTALSLLKIAIQNTPDDRRVWGKLGAMLLSMGEKEGAEAAFEQALKIAPRSVNALGALNLVTPFERGSHRARLLRDLAKAPATSGFEKAIAWNALGRIEERAGHFPAAFRCFEKSNKAQKPDRFRSEAFDWLVEGQEQQFQPGAPSGPPEGPSCIFVVGMPRSGTTLVEQVLTRHPMVRSTGEGGQLSTVLAMVRKQFAGDGNPWHWITEASEDDLARARAVFFRRIAPPAGLEKPFVMNKLPLSCFDMGFAQRLLPDARFVFMSRHPLDVGLSNFCTHFHEAHPWSKTQTGIARMIRAVYRSLDDYVPKLGNALRVQSYAALVANPDAQIRALVDHVGLPWDAACLAPEAGQGPVRTASVMQVREAINSKGLDKWQRYAPQLAPMIAALEQDWLDQWAARDADWAVAGADFHRR